MWDGAKASLGSAGWGHLAHCLMLDAVPWWEYGLCRPKAGVHAVGPCQPGTHRRAALQSSVAMPMQDTSHCRLSKMHGRVSDRHVSEQSVTLRELEVQL